MFLDINEKSGLLFFSVQRNFTTCIRADLICPFQVFNWYVKEQINRPPAQKHHSTPEHCWYQRLPLLLENGNWTVMTTVTVGIIINWIKLVKRHVTAYGQMCFIQQQKLVKKWGHLGFRKWQWDITTVLQ